MNARIMTAVMALSLLALTGCNGGLRNMLYGRGAACGACAGAGPQYDIAAPGAYGPQSPACGSGQCGSGYGGPECEYGGVSAYAPAIGGPYGEAIIPGIPGEYPGSGYGYPATGPENWVPAGEAVVPGSSYMSEPTTPMASPAR